VNRKRHALIIVISIGICFFFLFGEIKSICSEENKAIRLKEPPIFLSISDLFKDIERPPVKFYHGKHAEALKQKGCSVCHSADQEGDLVYVYPKIRNEARKKTLMNSYHDDCIGCHNKTTNEGKKTGPVTCGECHIWDNQQQSQKKAPWPDAGFDYYLHHLHSDAAGGDCGVCHHTGDMTSCRDCHGEKDVNEILSFREAAHSSCIKCHMEYEAGPSSCSGCHSEAKRTIAEMANTPHPDIGQPEKMLITVQDAKMKGVPFDHEPHQGYTHSCRTCHHKTMSSCKTCHTLKGSAEGRGTTLAFAFHEASSERSCVGCHNTKKSEALCAGCHHLMKTGFTETSCLVCHSGALDEASQFRMPGDPDDLLPENLPEVIKISVLEKDYMPAEFSHYTHIKKLTGISNENNLARYFHSSTMTICLGCHHYSQIEEKKLVPPCITCHASKTEPKNNTPTLLSAYHRQCLGCHKKMEIEPTDCTGCHVEKSAIKTKMGKK